MRLPLTDLLMRFKDRGLTVWTHRPVSTQVDAAYAKVDPYTLGRTDVPRIDRALKRLEASETGSRLSAIGRASTSFDIGERGVSASWFEPRLIDGRHVPVVGLSAYVTEDAAPMALAGALRHLWQFHNGLLPTYARNPLDYALMHIVSLADARAVALLTVHEMAQAGDPAVRNAARTGPMGKLYRAFEGEFQTKGQVTALRNAFAAGLMDPEGLARDRLQALSHYAQAVRALADKPGMFDSGNIPDQYLLRLGRLPNGCLYLPDVALPHHLRRPDDRSAGAFRYIVDRMPHCACPT